MASFRIDGNQLEGGGQIIRVATALCCIKEKSVKISNVRGNRKPPGLKAQSLTGLKLTADLCHGILSKTSIGSLEFELTPGKIKSGNYEADTKTAGSIALLLQITLPCLIYGKEMSEVTLCGGTNAEFAPSIDYYQQIFLPSIAKFGIKCDFKMIRRGFYPRGGGKVIAKISPVQFLHPIEMIDFGAVLNITGLVYIAGNLPKKLAQTMLDTAKSFFKDNFPQIPFTCDISRENNDRAVGTGLGIFLKAETSTGCILGSSAISKKGSFSSMICQTIRLMCTKFHWKTFHALRITIDLRPLLCNNMLICSIANYEGIDPAETSKMAAEELVEQLQNEVCVDQHLQDQFIIFMALARGSSRIKSGPLTLHTKTAIAISEQVLEVKFVSETTNDGNIVLSCEGIGMEYLN